MEKKNLFGMTRQELQDIFLELGEPQFRAQQLYEWLYVKGVTDTGRMTNLSKLLREKLDCQFRVEQLHPQQEKLSADGTIKYLYPAPGYKFIEAAYIPHEDKATLCVSTQVGCKMGCLFCMTARQGFQGQLSTGEILSQVYSLPHRDSLTNIVYMGMGEPMDNIDAVIDSILILSDPKGRNMSQRRITVSTIGIIPAMRRFLSETRANLAVSIHNPFDEERRQMMPVQNVYPIQEVVHALRDYDFRERKLSFEYILFEGINDSPRHARELVRLLNGLRCRVNLIHFHSIPDSPLRGTPRAGMEAFQDILKSKGLITTIRKSRGEDIQAACGLLSTLELVKMQGEAELADY